MENPQVPPTELLRRIVRLARELDGDLRAYGPETVAAHLVELPRHLDDACNALIKAFERSRAFNDAFVQDQVAKAGLVGRKDLRVQLGGGPQEVEGWVNVDFHPGQIAVNARWGLPFADESVKYLYSSHMLEHFYFRFESIPLLQEMRRVLQPDGVLRLVVPDIGMCLDAYNRGDDQFFEDRKQVWPWANACRSHLEHFLEYAGANQYDVSFEGHKYGYDYPTLAASLQEAGFSRVSRSTYMGSVHADLNLDHVSIFASAVSKGANYSLFVEASK